MSRNVFDLPVTSSASMQMPCCVMEGSEEDISKDQGSLSLEMAPPVTHVNLKHQTHYGD